MSRKASRFYVTPVPAMSDTRHGIHAGLVTDGVRVFLICTEGVGWEITDDDKWEITMENGDERVWDPAQAISEMNKSEHEPMRLDKWVRVFGSRLDSNVYLWEHRLEEAFKV